MPAANRRRGIALAGAVALLLTVAVAGDLPETESTSRPTASVDPSARCELSPEAEASAMINLRNRAFGPAVTVNAGETVAFVSLDDTSHTVTEGVSGHAADNACARQRLAPRGSTAVTFHLAGDYRFTCTIHASMHTAVHVR